MSGLTGKLSGIVVKALTTKGKNSRAANAAIAKAAKSNDMSVDAYKKAAKAQIKADAKPVSKTVKGEKPSDKKPSKFGKGQAREIQRLTGINPRSFNKKTLEEQQAILNRQSEREIPSGRRTSTTDSAGNKVEGGVNTDLLSKAQLDPKLKNYSRALIRRLIKNGEAKIVRMKNGKVKVVTTGQYAPPRAEVAEAMGLTGRGKISEREIKNMTAGEGGQGFEIRKKGGRVGLGCGAALRGGGAVRSK
jgi:hypothetical protein